MFYSSSSLGISDCLASFNRLCKKKSHFFISIYNNKGGPPTASMPSLGKQMILSCVVFLLDYNKLKPSSLLSLEQRRNV